ncbi:MAG: KamA family radical SAM protein [Chitinivibrionales bacterium]|nr:KamA family radical SAM protein [Chitinivibrionales bacterium]MBD3394959.1 KamA family radical SAM protein [Chitinivibrionales bacterium]
MRPVYITDINGVSGLSEGVRNLLSPICGRYTFRANSYYLGLIDWDDPADPIRRIVIPDEAEMERWGRLDASDESTFTVAPGVEHKYSYTALLLVNDVCGGYCRFCFRKRLFMDCNDEVVRDVEPGLDYIRAHTELTNILLSGGDPLVMSTRRLSEIVRKLRLIDHIEIIRIGTKIPAFNPHRILEDPSLLDMIRAYSTNRKRIYFMVHFNHPRELTDYAIKAVRLLQEAGAVVTNQTPLLRGVNDDPVVLAELLRTLSFCGIPPYYVFQGRPTEGNHHFAIPVERSWEIFEQARALCSGLAKRARLVMSHSTGKIEVLGKTDGHVYMRYHRAADPEEKARFMVLESNPDAYWFDDYDQITRDYSIDLPYRCFGPE